MNQRIKFSLLLLIIVLAAALRFFKLGSNPPSPYWEEAALGYDAFSILKTGKDLHGNPWPLVAFESFGDWKPSLYFYALVPAEALFGLNIWSIRLPSALAGTLTVLVAYLLVGKLFMAGKKRTKDDGVEVIALVSAFLLAVSPWHVQFSRAGFEANLAFFLLTLGAWLFILGLRRGFFLPLATAVWALSLYAYHGERVLVPLLGLVWGLLFIRRLWLRRVWVVVAAVIFLVAFWPIWRLSSQPQVAQRFAETSAFATLEPILESNRLIAEDGNTRWAKLIHHRFWHYGKILVNNYFSHYSFDFLFLSGDTNPRHSIQLVGNLYLIQLFPLLLGLFFLFARKQWWLLPLLFWLLLAPVPAAMTSAVPHSLRSLPMVLPLTVLSAYGVVEFLSLVGKRKSISGLLLGMFLLAFILEFFRYLFIYFEDYPKDYSQHWQYGYRDLMELVSREQKKYDYVYITRSQGRPSIYFWFYNQTDPRQVQSWEEKVPKDQGEFLQFENIYFGVEPKEKSGKSLWVEAGSEAFPGKLIKEINFLDGYPAFKIYER